MYAHVVTSEHQKGGGTSNHQSGFQLDIRSSMDIRVSITWNGSVLRLLEEILQRSGDETESNEFPVCSPFYSHLAVTSVAALSLAESCRLVHRYSNAQTNLFTSLLLPKKSHIYGYLYINRTYFISKHK